jgi:hypothetical protein
MERSFEDVKVSVLGVRATENLSESLCVDPDKIDLISRMGAMPGKYSFWLRLSVEQGRVVQDKQEALDAMFANKKNTIRKALPKSTETNLKEQVIIDPEYKAAQHDLQQEIYVLDIIKNVVLKAYVVAMDMARSIIAFRKAESQYLMNNDTPQSGRFNLEHEGENR